eukprot:CAMPEP_0119131764 /NCGR_PEP_ID=MMETSP1310-20130426/10560_1 /TAXON_ID=464262 /ORGANISM="Genus nov. species nov., Strain RCC2339" /LENGTH=341 /DNA_ID=CAMNT_0007122357 /DNA_START=216 /DNA_END=1238 /DNA_ORIENTATION=-
MARIDLQAKRLMTLICIAIGSFVCFCTGADFLNNNDLRNYSQALLGWAVACGVTSFVIASSLIAVWKFQPRISDIVAPFAGGGLTIWWSFGVGFLTGASGPFANTNNGFFGTWMAFVASLYYLYLSVENIKTTLEGRDFVNGMMAVALASVVEFCAAADYQRLVDCDSPTTNLTCSSMGWSISVGVISFVIAFTQLAVRSYIPRIAERSAPIVGAFLVLWWSFGAGFNTASTGPFTNTCRDELHGAGRANGYLSTWAAFFSSLFYCICTILDLQQVSSDLIGDEDSYDAMPPPDVGEKARLTDPAPTPHESAPYQASAYSSLGGGNDTNGVVGDTFSDNQL